MCFSIPYKVNRIKNGTAFVEGGKTVKTGTDLKVEKGGYLQVVGNVAVGSLNKSQGLKIRRLIKSLNQ